MRRLDRYLLREILTPVFLATGIALMLLLANRAFKLAPVLLQADVPLGPFLSVLGLLVPPFLVAAMPIALYMATIYVGSRLVRTGEWGAILSSGVSPGRATLVVPLLAVVLSALAQYSVWTLGPRGRAEFGQAIARLVSENAHRTLAPGQVHVLPKGLNVYYAERDGHAWLHPIFVWQPEGSAGWVLGAARANVEFVPDGETWQFVLQDGWMVGDPRQPLMYFDSLTLDTNPFGGAGRQWTGIRESTWEQLQRAMAKGKPKVRRAAQIEVHARVMLGVMLVVLPLAALGLGIGRGNARRGKGEAYLAGLLLYGVFYVVSYSMQRVTADLSGPVWLPLWSACALFSLVALGIYVRFLRA